MSAKVIDIFTRKPAMSPHERSSRIAAAELDLIEAFARFRAARDQQARTTNLMRWFQRHHTTPPKSAE